MIELGNLILLWYYAFVNGDSKSEMQNDGVI